MSDETAVRSTAPLLSSQGLADTDAALRRLALVLADREVTAD